MKGLAGLCLLTALLAGHPAMAETLVRGRVTDARTGEPVGGAELRILGISGRTAAGGHYEIQLTTADTRATIQVNVVGYRPLSQSIELTGPVIEVDFALHTDTLRRSGSETVTVSAGPFESTSANGLDLAGSELRNLASVLADDPMRAVQSLPGVGAFSDFQSQFTIRGAGFDRVGIYLDGVLLHQPFHSVQGNDNSASLSWLQGELLESASVEAGPIAPRYADRTAGVVDFRTRDGDASHRIRGRATASASNAALSAEGRLGNSKLTWLAAIRKSYLQYIVNRVTDDPGLGFGFWDAQGKLTYRPNAAHQLSLAIFNAHSGLDRTRNASRFGLNTLVTSDYESTLAIGAWRMSMSDRFLLNQRGAVLLEDYTNRNRNTEALGSSRYREAVWSGDAAVSWTPHAVTEAGWSVRKLNDDGYVNQILNPPLAARRVESYRGGALRTGAYAQQSWSPGSRIQIRFGGRLDHHDRWNGVAMSPFASLSFPAPAGGRLMLSWSQAAQFAELRQYLSPVATAAFAPERAQHLQAAIEYPWSAGRGRVRLEVFERKDRDLLFEPRGEPRLVRGAIVAPLSPAPWTSSLRGRARGWQATVQRRSANGLTGWIAYTYARTEYREPTILQPFVSDFDLRHQLQTFASYRIRPTVHVSSRYVYATGQPLRGFFARRSGDYYLSEFRNLLRLPDYQRWDIRFNKAFVRKRYQATLFVEAVNLTNRRNQAIDNLTGFDARTGLARIQLLRTFPIVPSAGVVFDFF